MAPPNLLPRASKPRSIRPLGKDITPMFRVREEKDAFVHTLTNTSDTVQAKQQRKDVCQRVPGILRSSRNLTTEELDQVGWVQAGAKPHYLEIDVGGKQVRYPFLQFIDEKHIFSSNAMLCKFTKMQEIAVQPEFRERLKKVTRKKEATYELGFSVEPGNNRENALQLSPTGKVIDEEFSIMRQMFTECAVALIKECFPDLAQMLQRRWCLDASLTIGSEDNFAISGMQMNFTTLDDIEEENGKSQSLGDFSGLHMDGLDDPGRVTVILNLSHLPQSHFPGRFNITTACITVPNAPFTAIIFRGTHPHFSTGFGKYSADIALDSPLRYQPAGGVQLPILPEGTPYCRIVPVGYPKQCLARPTSRTIRGTLFDELAINTFGTKRAHQEWRMRMYLKEGFNTLPEGTEPADVCEAYSWTNENGDKHAPREHIAQTLFDCAGMEDTEWKEANDAAALVSVGKKFTNPKTGGQVKFASEIWTKLDGTAEDTPLEKTVADTIPNSQGIGPTGKAALSEGEMSATPAQANGIVFAYGDTRTEKGTAVPKEDAVDAFDAFDPHPEETDPKNMAREIPTEANKEVSTSQGTETQKTESASKEMTTATPANASGIYVEPRDTATETKATSKRKASAEPIEAEGRKKAKLDDGFGGV